VTNPEILERRVVLYRKCTQWTIRVLYGKRRLTENIWGL